MLKESVAALLVRQVNAEFFSSHLYLDLANWCEHKGYDGFANWYEVQALEERDHAMLFYHYLHNNDAEVVLDAIPQPNQSFAGLGEVLEAGLKHERYVTALINHLYDEAQQAKDFRTVQFLDWFVREQGEEETSATDLITKFGLYGGDPKGLYLLNTELKARAYAAPTLTLV